jgi:hypothetical protein
MMGGFLDVQSSLKLVGTWVVEFCVAVGDMKVGELRVELGGGDDLVLSPEDIAVICARPIRGASTQPSMRRLRSPRPGSEDAQPCLYSGDGVVTCMRSRWVETVWRMPRCETVMFGHLKGLALMHPSQRRRRSVPSYQRQFEQHVRGYERRLPL